MAHFRYSIETPNLLDYLFEADLVVSVIPPQNYTAVPTKDSKTYLHWDKSIGITDTINDLYAEIYRTEDLLTWTLIASRQWLNYSDYTDLDVAVNHTYYYRLRFVRLSTDGVTTNVSNYTAPIGVKIVSLLGVEPRDIYSNKFFKHLLNGLPGTRIYDRTEAAHFSSTDYHLWQTTCKILDGFSVFVDGSEADTQNADPTALYAKRNITFLLDKKHSSLTSTEQSTGIAGDVVQVNSYLVHTFMMSYAIQFMALYEKYFQIVSDKFIDYSQIYTKGFKPVVSDRKNISVAELWYSFGSLLGLQPLRSQDLDQGLVRYKSTLKNSFANQDNLGKLKGINQACENTLGITTQTILEYYKQHWFKSDREHKLFVMPSGTDQHIGYVNLPTTTPTPNNGLEYILDDDKFWATIWYTSGYTPAGELQVLGSSPDDPYSYLFNVGVSSGVTTANDIIALFAANPIATSIMTVNNSGGSSGAGIIPYVSGHEGELLRMHSPWVGWEDSLVKMYDKSFRLKDIASSTDTGTDNSNFSCSISAEDPTYKLPPANSESISDAVSEKTAWNAMEGNDLLAVRDDASDGVSYFTDKVAPDDSITITGEKRILFKINLTDSKMEWTKRALLKMFVNHSSEAGYIRLYRVRKKYNSDDICWNFREKEAITDGYEWDNATEEYIEVSGVAAVTNYWVTKDWDTPGAKADSDVVFLKEFYIPKINIDSPAWATMDVTDVIKDLYKYEASRLNMGEDPENLKDTGFMLTLESYSNKSILSIKGHSDSTLKPKITWEKQGQGFYPMNPDDTRYFYIDGTTRYGRLLVQDSDREPISYVKTVNERVRQEDIKFSSDTTLTLSANAPTEFIPGVQIYGETSNAVGTISSVTREKVYVSVQLKNFVAGETVRELTYNLGTVPASATISTISYVGNKYIKLSRVPVSTSLIRVYHTGSGSTPGTPPATYPVYTTWTEEGDGIEPVFLSSVSGTINVAATRDTDELDVIYLNSSDSASDIGDIIVTYQYQYDYTLIGRAVSDSDSVSKLEGCNRLGNGLFSQRENDYLYQTEVMLPMPSTGELVDISGDMTVNEYSNFNLGVLSDAIKNVRRYNGLVDVFKYQPEDRPYRFGHLYHTFFRRV